jgi:hypothetical protein
MELLFKFPSRLKEPLLSLGDGFELMDFFQSVGSLVLKLFPVDPGFEFRTWKWFVLLLEGVPLPLKSSVEVEPNRVSEDMGQREEEGGEEGRRR